MPNPTTKSRSQDLLDAASCRVPVTRIRELRKVQSTALALRLLLASDQQEAQDAYNRLVRLCRAALRKWSGGRPGLWWSSGGDTKGRDSGSDDLIAKEILRVKGLYRYMSRRAILLAVLNDDRELRYIPRRVCLRVIDLLRKFGGEDGEKLDGLGHLPPRMRAAFREDLQRAAEEAFCQTYYGRYDAAD